MNSPWSCPGPAMLEMLKSDFSSSSWRWLNVISTVQKVEKGGGGGG